MTYLEGVGYLSISLFAIDGKHICMAKTHIERKIVCIRIHIRSG